MYFSYLLFLLMSSVVIYGLSWLLLTYFVHSFYLKNILSNFIANQQQEVLNKIDLEGTDQEITNLINQQLDSLVILFKKEIPIAAFYLTNQLIEKLKDKARVEMIKMAPDLKKRVVGPILEKLKEPQLKDSSFILKSLKPTLHFMTLSMTLFTLGINLIFLHTYLYFFD